MKILGREIKFSIRIGRERRRADRVSLHDTLYLDYRRPFDPTHGAGEGKNISTAGILFAATSIIPVGSFLELTLHLYPAFATTAPLLLQGRVVRCFQTSAQQHYRIACAFNPLEPHVAERLRSFIYWLKELNQESFYR